MSSSACARQEAREERRHAAGRRGCWRQEEGLTGGSSLQQQMFGHAIGPWSMVITRSWVEDAVDDGLARLGLAPPPPRPSPVAAGAALERALCSAVVATGKQHGGSRRRPTGHAHTHAREATGMRLSRQRAAELSLSHRRQRDPTAAAVRTGTGCRNLLLAQAHGAIMSSQVQPTHKPLHPPATCMRGTARNAVTFAMSVLAVRVLVCLCLPSHRASASHPPLRAAATQPASKPGRTSRKTCQWRSIPRLRLAPPVPYTLSLPYLSLVSLPLLLVCFLLPCSSRERPLLPTGPKSTSSHLTLPSVAV